MSQWLRVYVCNVFVCAGLELWKAKWCEINYKIGWVTCGFSVADAISDIFMSIGTRVSYNVGACNIMPAVPTTTAIVNNHKNKRSNTIATYFQSSFTCKNHKNYCLPSTDTNKIAYSDSKYAFENYRNGIRGRRGKGLTLDIQLTAFLLMRLYERLRIKAGYTESVRVQLKTTLKRKISNGCGLKAIFMLHIFSTTFYPNSSFLCSTFLIRGGKKRWNDEYQNVYGQLP